MGERKGEAGSTRKMREGERDQHEDEEENEGGGGTKVEKLNYWFAPKISCE